MVKYKVKQDKNLCIGCGVCVAVCPGNWEMTDDGKAKPKKSESDLDCNKEAADACPVNCIHVEEVK